MCDYSLHQVANRPAKIHDELVTTRFRSTPTSGFAPVGEPNIAVCLLPGTEIAFDKDVEVERLWHFGFLRGRNIGQRLARFRQINIENKNAHHDALEFPGGKVVLLTRLVAGQRATILQMPVGDVSRITEQAPSPGARQSSHVT